LRREYSQTPLCAVSGVIFDSEERVLLVRRGRPPARGKWSLPGGVVQLGEELEEALKREILEESGLVVEGGPLLAVSSRIVRDQDGKIQYHYILLDYLCRFVQGQLRAGSDAEDVGWFEWNTLEGLDLTEGVLGVIRKGREKVGEKMRA